MAGGDEDTNAFRDSFRHDFASLSGRLQEAVLLTIPELRVPTSETDHDEGSFADRSGAFAWYWRRAVTRQLRQELDAAAAAGDDRDSENLLEDPWNWFIIYRSMIDKELIAARVRRGKMLQSIVSIDQLPFDIRSL